MQNEISDGQSKDKEDQDKYLGPPQQAQKGYDQVPDPPQQAQKGYDPVPDPAGINKEIQQIFTPFTPKV